MSAFDTGVLWVGVPAIGAALYQLAHSPKICKGVANRLQRLANKARAWTIAQYVRQRTYQRALKKFNKQEARSGVV